MHSCDHGVMWLECQKVAPISVCVCACVRAYVCACKGVCVCVRGVFTGAEGALRVEAV